MDAGAKTCFSAGFLAGVATMQHIVCFPTVWPLLQHQTLILPFRSIGFDAVTAVGVWGHDC